MANDLFGYSRNPKPAGVISSESTTLVIGSAAGAALATLVQGWSVQYQQNVEQIFELGSNKVYWKKGRPQGGGNISRMVGAGVGAGVTAMPSEALDVCQGGATMQFTVGGGSCAGAKPINITCSGVIVTGSEFSAQAADPQVSEGITWRFSSLSVA